MSRNKISLTHDQESIIAAYCAYNELDFNQANAYDRTMDAFKENPIKYKTIDDISGEEKNYNVTARIARLIENQPKTIDRIADKIERKKDEIQQEFYTENIAKAKERSCPDINKLVDNLYRLNLADEESYLGLVCFLMQVKHSRDGKIPDDDKLGVFFNGVARNGKSATAKAIMRVEERYGPVLKVGSARVLQSTHEERLFKTHVVYFDEVKSADIQREDVLNLINGGDFELNPKNKRIYVYPVKTNVIMASNDMVYFRQRRIAVIKFGKRLNCRPLGEESLTDIITNVMDSLPDFEHYNDLYQVVSKNNENNVSMAAISYILSYLHKYMSFVCDGNPLTLEHNVLITAHMLYENIKYSRNTQLVNPERREAIPDALEYLEQLGLVTRSDYESSTTKYYTVSGAQYLKMRAKFDALNTKYEKINRISKTGLYDCLLPYFTAKQDLSEYPQIECPEPSEEENAEPNDNTTFDENAILNTNWTKGRGGILAFNLLRRIWRAKEASRFLNMESDFIEDFTYLFEKYMTPEFCRCVCYEDFLKMLNRHEVDYGETFVPLVQGIYMDRLGLKELKHLEAFEDDKRAEIKKINDNTPSVSGPTE